jgi:hypothetical protein
MGGFTGPAATSPSRPGLSYFVTPDLIRGLP